MTSLSIFTDRKRIVYMRVANNIIELIFSQELLIMLWIVGTLNPTTLLGVAE